MKKGEYVICKKTETYPEYTANHIIQKDKFYQIYDIIKGTGEIFIIGEKNYHQRYVLGEDFDEFFYTQKELRQLKLDSL